MKIIVFIISIFLLWIISPLFIVYAFIKFIFNKGLTYYLYNTAISIDQLGNVIGAPIMNLCLITKDSKYPFGNPDQTISYVLGMNYKLNSLNKLGLLIVKILNKIDNQHVEKAVKYEQ